MNFLKLIIVVPVLAALTLLGSNAILPSSIILSKDNAHTIFGSQETDLACTGYSFEATNTFGCADKDAKGKYLCQTVLLFKKTANPDSNDTEFKTVCNYMSGMTYKTCGNVTLITKKCIR